MPGRREHQGLPGPPDLMAGAARRDLAAEAVTGIVRLEGYLLAQRARTEAAEAGAAFAHRFPWLGPGEEAEVARAFAQEHLAVRRRMLEAAVAHAEELRREYGRRYACLRRRLVGTALGVAAGAAAVLWVVAVARGAG
ncbi:hypothetical protein [Streptomyces sp. NK15101]|uniref:hypothetical protein n=1 Tax=Streptomyces sp. NK15101 TaxID=2873261 RepID=UPI001CECEE96|nr:hypothetical protein [Streptomyces sp. NK15101]